MPQSKGIPRSRAPPRESDHPPGTAGDPITWVGSLPQGPMTPDRPRMAQSPTPVPAQDIIHPQHRRAPWPLRITGSDASPLSTA